uniref:PRKCSH_1 domain-containing protein n=1 Tax=Mesocestoides corti TaxID=53468 RepID=A0A5K3F8H9_MESCO
MANEVAAFTMLDQQMQTCSSSLTNVKVACGPENKLVSAEEPSRCTYVMKLETPAACHHEPLKLMEMHTEL